nr:MAG TPA: DNA N-6-adenine-methyltransferase [Caudoviricetes sp.]
MNTDVMFSSKTGVWETPEYLFKALDAEFRFSLDVCATKENAKCKNYFTPEQDGLKQRWIGTCWCNPPYGRGVGNWVKKAAECGATVVMLLPARTDTQWFHEYIYGHAEIRFIKGRLKFGNAQNNAPFPSMIVIFRDSEEREEQ